ncbi:hypothetical protein N7519_010703 [Penicillium mononematosum]|uniref:uncharacterized protein n=1 Tax=Penicillium mononematosum TaxID=268346 RepID=UPI002549156B|nr:uncharacterized protein N7519_010703 [Penicillium mononematosum]KAJ6180242.1 hypothetical protein N7519_010703 [Penicillium mononematosum]
MSWDWRSALITYCTLCLAYREYSAAQEARRVLLCPTRACWRRLLPETDPRATPDLEQNPDGQEHELDDLAMVICPPSPLPLSPSWPRTRLNRRKTDLTLTVEDQLQGLEQQKARVIMQEIAFWTNLFTKSKSFSSARIPRRRAKRPNSPRAIKSPSFHCS